MVVVVILSVLTAMIAPQFAGTYQAALLRGTARKLVTAVRLASSEAVTRNRVVRLNIDAEKHRYWMECPGQELGVASTRTSIQDVPGAAGELHEQITVQVRSRGQKSRQTTRRRGRRAKAPARGQSIPFNPDGTTEAREIVLRDREGFGLGLRIHPTTARVSTITLEPEPGMRPIGTGPPGTGPADRRTP